GEERPVPEVQPGEVDVIPVPEALDREGALLEGGDERAIVHPGSMYVVTRVRQALTGRTRSSPCRRAASSRRARRPRGRASPPRRARTRRAGSARPGTPRRAAHPG